MTGISVSMKQGDWGQEVSIVVDGATQPYESVRDMDRECMFTVFADNEEKAIAGMYKALEYPDISPRNRGSILSTLQLHGEDVEGITHISLTIAPTEQ